MPDEERRRALYAGEIFVYAETPATRALCGFAREMVEAAFAPHDPRRIHEVMPVEECVAVLAELKPRFIHHPRAKALLQDMLREFGCDPDATYFDVPRLRSAMPKDYLAAGIAYAFHPHRDTWYSAPFCQINWWLPVYDLAPDNAMAFHPRYWRHGVRNSSALYNYDRWNAESRRQAAQHIRSDTRVQPRAQEAMELEPELRLLCPPGGAILFSAAQMHSTVPNTTPYARWSIDFRTVNIDDALVQRGAPNVDSACTGTTMRDYLRVRDLAHLPEAVIALHDVSEPTSREPETVG
jgi:hypothetical protein